MKLTPFAAAFLSLPLLFVSPLVAQTAEPGTKPETVAPPPVAAKQPVISPTARLTAAKTIYIKKVNGSNDIPFNVISNSFDGWAKYMVIASPEKADLIV